MAVTYDTITTSTVATATNTITLSSLSQSFTDLYVSLNFLATSAPTNVYVRFNNDSAGNYNYGYYSGAGSADSYTSSALGANQLVTYAQVGSVSTPNIINFHVLQYSNTNVQKVFMARVGSPNSEVGYFSGNYNSSSAINRIDLITNTGNFAVGTTVTVYGILKA